MGHGLQRAANTDTGEDVAGARVEPFAASDSQQVLRLAQYALAQPDEQLGAPLWLARGELEHELSTWQIPPSRGLFVAREGGTVVGVGGVECYPSSGLCLLHGPIVHPGVRGRGIGGQILRVALRAARWHGMREVHAAVGRENARAERILLAEGFARGDVNAVYRLERSRHRPLGDGTGLELRRAGPADPAALGLAERCGTGHQLPLDELRAALRDATQHVYVGWLDGEAVGLVVVDTRDTWVYGLCVRDDASERGLGAALLSRALTRFWEERPLDALGMTVRMDNLAAINLYRRQGFEPWLVLVNYARAL